jgi:hypothetical protein
MSDVKQPLALFCRAYEQNKGMAHSNCLSLFGVEQDLATPKLQNGLVYYVYCQKCPVHMWLHEPFSIMTIISVSGYVSNLGTSKPLGLSCKNNNFNVDSWMNSGIPVLKKDTP